MSTLCIGDLANGRHWCHYQSRLLRLPTICHHIAVATPPPSFSPSPVCCYKESRLVSPITFTMSTTTFSNLISIVSGVSFRYFPLMKLLILLENQRCLGGFFLSLLLYGKQAIPAVMHHQCRHTSSVRVPTIQNQPTLPTPVYKSLASLLYKSNPFRSPGRKSTLRPQAVLLNLHKLLGTRFPTPTHHIDTCPSTFLYILRIRILDFPIYTTHKNPRLRYQLSQIPM